MMLGCSAETSAACSQCCADFCRFIYQKLPLPKLLSQSSLAAKHQFLFLLLPETYSHSRSLKSTMYRHRWILRLRFRAESLMHEIRQISQLCPASCYMRPFIVLCPSYPQPMVLLPLIPTRIEARVIPVISVRRGLPNPPPKEVALAQAQEGSDTRLQVLL
jgi:hypothetical protein